MKLIQLILVPALLLIISLYFLKFRSRLIDRMVVLLFGLTGAILVAMPDLTQKLANILGVGRGVDLVMYLAFIGLSFVCFLFFSKLREIHQQMTDLARAQAIAHAKRPEESDSKGK